MEANIGIMKTRLGFAGQPGYLVEEGQEVWITDGGPTGGRFFVAPKTSDDPADYDGPWIHAELGEVSPYIDFDDITTGAEIDDYHGGTPWDDCDGFEHEFVPTSYYDHDDRTDANNYVNRRDRDGGSGYIEISDEQVVKWGCTGPSGCSKQVRAEAIAAAKRKTVDLLVNWYENGWTWYTAYAKFEDEALGIEEAEYCGGIEDEDYAEEMARDELRGQLVYAMEKAGYTVINVPADCPDREEAYRQNRRKAKISQIRYNLTGVWS